MGRLAAVLVFLVGLVQLVPVVGAFTGDFQRLYGVEVVGSDLDVLMRNRAVYLGAVGALLIWSSFAPNLRLAAIALSVVTLGSYVVIALLVGGVGDRLRQLVVIDIVAVALLASAAWAHLVTRR